MLVILHLPYGLSFIAPSWHNESRIISFFILFWVLEDFLWFVLNPAFGIKRFKAERIWWHASTWWWIMPKDYWIFTPIGVGLYWYSL